MSDWNMNILTEWDEKICKVADKFGLDGFPISYEVCDYYDMIGNMSYHGMPTHYHHWSYGKAFERTHLLYNTGLTGLPYELIINSNPSLAYLMKENSLYLQILIMAHCMGHSDFFKNNRCFENTFPDTVVSKFRNAKKRVQKYIEDEQPDTQFDLSKKILPYIQGADPKNNILVRFDAKYLTPQNFQILVNLSDILKESGEVGDMELEIFKFHVKSLDSYESELINVVRSNK